MNNGQKKDDELKKFMKEIYTPPIVREKNEGAVSPRKRKLKSDLCNNKYILKEASEEKLQKDLNREVQNAAKVIVHLKEFQNKATQIETLESAVKVKDKTLNNLKLSHDKLKEKLKESTFKLRANTESTAKLNEKLERKTKKKMKNEKQKKLSKRIQ